MGTTTTPELQVNAQMGSALWGLFVAPFLAGDEPFSAQITLQEVSSVDTLVPADAIRSSTFSRGTVIALAEVGSCAVLLTHWGTTVDVAVRGKSRAAVDHAVKQLRSNAPVAEPDASMVAFDFWQVSQGAYKTTRRIESPAWEDICGNYPHDVRIQVEPLFERPPSLEDGRIILWHGPPGTGKTTAIRALARAWGETRRAQVVLDPDLVFARSSTLMELLLDDEEQDDRWRVLVIEDADELLRVDAKERVGQALSRLLNLGGGLLGQGIRVQVLITTNEPVRRLHPALIRPGRCLADIEFRAFTRGEAVNSFGSDVPTGDTLTLAQLINRSAEDATPELTGTGVYL